MCLSLILTVTASAVPVESLKVMSFNIWTGGFGSFMPLSRTIDVIATSGADIIGLQESSASPDDIADALGFYWQAFNTDLAIISRYPISQVLTSGDPRTRGAKIQLSPGQEVYLFDTHLQPFPYEPYSFRDGLLTTDAEAIASAQATRGASLTSGLNATSEALVSGLPVFYVGDFNEPSHLDWTESAANAGLNFGTNVAWPASTAVEKAGFIDAFRELRPDPVTDPGRTWTPGTPYPMVSPTEVHDRIDYVYYHSEFVTPVLAQTLGPTLDDGNTDIAILPYPSDHRAVVVEFDLNPVPGDFDFDRDVDGHDFLYWQRDPTFGDWGDWQTNYGVEVFSGSSYAVPEPGTWTLAVAAVMLVIGRYSLRD